MKENPFKLASGIPIAFLIAVLFAVFILSFGIGRYMISVPQVLNIITGELFRLPVNASPTAVTVIIKVRLPRIIAAMMVGGALSTAGATYQGLFRNPMVSPDLLGASTGAGFGAALALLLSLNMLGVSLFAFIMGLCAVALAYTVSSVIGRGNNSVLVLVLTGMVVSSLFSAFTSLIKYVADPDSKLPAISFWLMGGLNTITSSGLFILLIPMLIGMVPLFLFRWRLNVMSFGDEEAQAMGMDIKKYRLCFIFCATLLTAASVAVSGMIGWVGLVIPHIARMIVGPNYKKLLPASLIIGATFLIIVDDVARSAFVSEIPLGILTSIIGAPFFIFLMLKAKRGWQ